jgi:lipopolysaccharide transport system permease protein
VAAHSLPLIPIVFLIFGQVPGPEALLAIPGLMLIGINMLAGGLLLGMVCASFRDIPPIVANVVQLAFFVSPILWKPELLGDAMVWMAFNPFYALLETVRGPLLEGGGAAFGVARGYFLHHAACGVGRLFVRALPFPHCFLGLTPWHVFAPKGCVLSSPCITLGRAA